MPKKIFTPKTERMLRNLGLAVAKYARKKSAARGSKREKGKKAPKDILMPACLLVADGDFCRDPLPSRAQTLHRPFTRRPPSPEASPRSSAREAAREVSSNRWAALLEASLERSPAAAARPPRFVA